MRKIAVVLLGVSLLLSGAAGAQQKQSPAPPSQAAVEKQRQRIVAENVQLSDAEGAKFWPVYKAYRVEKNELLGRSAKLLHQYRTNAGKIDDAKALEMLRRMQRIREKEVQLRRAYVDRFAEALPARKVLRYYQVENRLEAIARYESTRVIQLKR